MTRRHSALCVARAAAIALLVAACSGKLQGTTYERLGDGGIGPAIPDVELSFAKEGASAVYHATTDASGAYTISLPAGRYYALASHPGYEDYDSAPGFVVVHGGQTGMANYFLRQPAITTVLIVRHAEKLDPASNAPTEPLSAAGTQRAIALRDDLLDSGVTAIYATDATRTRDTVAPLAAALGLTIQTYGAPAALAATVISQHRGDVVLVAAHSNTVAAVANAFGAQVPGAVVEDFDNLYVLTTDGQAVGVTNLQYGADSTPDGTKSQAAATVFMLVGHAGAGSPAAERLLHAARKANVAAIYTDGPNALVVPLETALGLTPSPYDHAAIAATVTEILAQHAGQTVVVAGTNDDLRGFVRELAGYPVPVLRPGDADQLVLMVRFSSGPVRVIPMRF